MKKILFAFSILVLPAFASAEVQTFAVQLSGDQEVPPVETQARGTVTVQVKGGSLSYRLITAGLENVVAAHFHCGSAGANGPVGVTLFAGAPVTVNGILAQGEVLMPNPGNLCAWGDVADIVSAMEVGDVYVNVHTLFSLPGEIRGQF